MLTLSRLLCGAVGVFLLLEVGTAGLIFAGTDFSVSNHLPHEGWNLFFQLNSWHHVLHIATGGLLAVTALKGWTGAGAFAFGAIYAVLAPLGFLDGDDVLNVFYSGAPENCIHAVLATGGITLGFIQIGRRARERRHGAIRPRALSRRESLPL
jgi:hypothetical protein